MTPQEQAFLQAILAEPDNDGLRLIYADWLDEHGGETVTCERCHGSRWTSSRVVGINEYCPDCKGVGYVPYLRAERAEFIRVQIELVDWKGKDGEHCPKCGQHWRWRVGVGESEWSDCENDHRWRSLDWGRNEQLRKREQELLVKILQSQPLPKPLNSGSVWRRGFIEELTGSSADWLAHADAITSQHPIRVVTLTDVPRVRVNYHRDGVVLDPHSTEAQPINVRDVALDVLRRRWKYAITFHLPAISE